LSDDSEKVNEKNREEVKKLLEKYREDANKRSLSNTENYDRSILTLSTAMLGFSLAFIRDMGNAQGVECKLLLPLSWLLFLTTIAVVLYSFRLSERGLAEALKNAESYYLDGDETAFSAPNRFRNWTEKLNTASGVLFVIASFVTILFVSINFSKTVMKPTETKGATIVAPQKVPLGATIPALQPAPPAPAPAPAPGTPPKS
jgi:hypothetical protein